MPNISALAGMAAVVCLALPVGFAKTPASLKNAGAAAKSAPSAIVIVFKDGHRQSFNLSDIAQVEFAGIAAEALPQAAPAYSAVPSRARFTGRWEVGTGIGDGKFVITLEESGTARRTLGDVHGKWVYAGGEARITWDDGAQDVIRKVGANYMKFAYGAGRSFTDTPDNVTPARDLSPRPI